MGFSDGTLRLFDPRDGSIIYEWKAHSTEITALDFTQDMKHLATASRDGTIRIWGIWP
jgi:WD40 repeat protein